MSIVVRPATAADLEAIAAIQRASPEASQWDPASYLTHDCTVAADKNSVVGFLVTRETAPGEREVLNVAVEPSQRRAGVARVLLQEALKSPKIAWFLEVRESNRAARMLYESLGFEVAGRRPNYYHEPPEGAIVMRFFS